MRVNTTEHLLADMERLRAHLEIEQWLLFGGSWGSTLILAYAERHPERVNEIVIPGVTMSRRSEIDWLYRGVGRFFPEEWERFRAGVPEDERDGDLLAAYARLRRTYKTFSLSVSGTSGVARRGLRSSCRAVCQCFAFGSRGPAYTPGKVRRVLLVIAAAGLLASAATAAQTAVPDTKRMVLQLGDLSTGFERTSGRYVSNTQAAKESPGKDYTGLGRVIGYESEFQRSGSGLTGILEITSSASLYKTSRGAHLSLLRSEASAQKARPAFRRLSLGAKLGHEAALYVTTLSRGGNKIDVYSIAWRSRNVFAAIIVGALANTADPAEVVALAAKQQRRITAATRKH